MEPQQALNSESNKQKKKKNKRKETKPQVSHSLISNSSAKPW